MVKEALRIAVIYALVAALWVLFSDQAVHLLVSDSDLESSIQTIKGWMFVLVTAILVYSLVSNLINQLQREVAVRVEHEAAILHQAHYDQLTDLPNRLLTLDRMQQAIIDAARRKNCAALLLIDLDHFKDINETLGHSMGDRLLQAVAQRLSEHMPQYDTLGRYGADEFLMVLRGLKSPTDCEPTATEVLQLLQLPFDIDGRKLVVTSSIGIAVYPADGEDADSLLRHADNAMHQGKLMSRNAFYFYTNELNTQAHERFALEQQLRGALARGEFELHYQPVFEAQTQTLNGAEALLRWRNPELGQVPPDRFIPLAEQLGLIQELGRWVLFEACRQLQAWQQQIGMPLTMSVNCSPVQFGEGQVCRDVRDCLEEFQIKPQNLVIEVTEGLLLLETERVTRALRELDEIGVGISLDDFGNGYASLGYMHKYPFDEVKIDRSFVREMTAGSTSHTMIKGIVALTRELNLHTVAEGVENADQLTLLQELGIDYVQGYLLGRPQPAEAFAAQFLALAGVSS